MKQRKVMIDIAGTALTTEDKELLKHPFVGGIILFSRNYESPEQLIHLTNEIHSLREPPLLIAVDQEGGRVQRFRDGFTILPAMGELGKLYDENPQSALEKAEHTGWTMGSELRAVGVNCSFAPVLDIDAGVSEVIGQRSFHSHPNVIAQLASSLVKGMHRAGILAVGKHFPGHGNVTADSHVAIPIDDRDLETIQTQDMLPFRELIINQIDGIMPAHVIYKRIDDKPPCFSSFWLQDQLRNQLGFRGIIFSDDLCMEGASSMGNIIERAQKAFDAGCNMVLVCNNRKAAIDVLQNIELA